MSTITTSHLVLAIVAVCLLVGYLATVARRLTDVMVDIKYIKRIMNKEWAMLSLMRSWTSPGSPHLDHYMRSLGRPNSNQGTVSRVIRILSGASISREEADSLHGLVEDAVRFGPEPGAYNCKTDPHSPRNSSKDLEAE